MLNRPHLLLHLRRRKWPWWLALGGLLFGLGLLPPVKHTHEGGDQSHSHNLRSSPANKGHVHSHPHGHSHSHPPSHSHSHHPSESVAVTPTENQPHVHWIWFGFEFTFLTDSWELDITATASKPTGKAPRPLVAPHGEWRSTPHVSWVLSVLQLPLGMLPSRTRLLSSVNGRWGLWALATLDTSCTRPEPPVPPPRSL